ncbi:MAG: 50S ribosome-binding GTPase [Gemmataceae bacterium]|nr:50S ribosome-binding GTPase [Gemmataceae bacterium]MDW8265448.1 GTPase [Gemmataceae bacterium]
MSYWRVAVVAILLLAPVLILAGIGSYALWVSGWEVYLQWGFVASIVLGLLLAWYWQRQHRLLPRPEFTPPLTWTERDHQAWKVVEQYARKVEQLKAEQLGQLSFYGDVAKQMALELAQVYYPGVADPIDPLTIPELLAVVELASHELAELIHTTLPAGHLLTVADWKRARKAAEWWQTASKIYWAVSALFSPVQTAARLAADRAGLSKPAELLKQNLIAWFYVHFVYRLGKYLIELHSGRLRVGAERYRQLMGQTLGRREAAATASVSAAARSVTLTLLGQVKAGKSSLVNALLGERRAATNVLPTTAQVTRYELPAPEADAKLVLLDTVGYGRAGPKADQLQATLEAAQESDLLLLVLHVLNPARQVDLDALNQIRDWFQARPHLKMPPVLAVVTHVDLLTPAMEWAPPYDWRHPQRPKEVHLAEALRAVQEQFGARLVAVVPACLREGKVFGIQEWVLPAIVERLQEAAAVGLVRCLWAEVNEGKVRRIFQQLLNAGLTLLRDPSTLRP